MKRRGVFVPLDHVEAAGGIVGGVLLAQIEYLMVRAARTHVDEEGWLRTTKAELMAMTGLTDAQYRRWLIKLEKLDLIERRGRVNGEPANLFVRVANCHEIPLPKQQGGACQNSRGTPAKTAGYTEYILEKVDKGKDEEPREEVEMTDEQRTVRDVLRDRITPRPKTENRKPSVTMLMSLWNWVHGEVWEGERVKGWGQTQRGMCARMIGAVEDDELAPAFEYALRNWLSFCRRLEKNTTAFDLPGRPDLGIMVKYSHEVVNFWKAQEAAPARKMTGKSSEDYLELLKRRRRERDASN